MLRRLKKLDSPVFEKLFKLAEIAGLTASERLKYEQGLKAEQAGTDDTAGETGKRKIDFETALGDFPFGILLKVRSLTPEEAERYKRRT